MVTTTAELAPYHYGIKWDLLDQFLGGVEDYCSKEDKETFFCCKGKIALFGKCGYKEIGGEILVDEGSFSLIVLFYAYLWISFIKEEICLKREFFFMKMDHSVAQAAHPTQLATKIYGAGNFSLETNFINWYLQLSTASNYRTEDSYITKEIIVKHFQ